MSKVLIETYRGFEITFDTEGGTFSAWSDHFDTQFAKKSFSGIKLGVDQHIKENNNFRPFKIQKVFGYSRGVIELGKVLTINSIRKDGKPTYDLNGKKKILSDYDVEGYALYNPDNAPLTEAYNELEQRREDATKAFDKEKEELLSNVVAEPLTDYLKTLNN